MSGYVGDTHSSLRVGRDCYDGNVVAALCILAQNGTIPNILSAAQNSGVSQRFIFWIEQHLLGKRNHLEEHSISAEANEAYTNAIENLYDLINFKNKYKDLNSLSLSARAWAKIRQVKQYLEPSIEDGKECSADLIRGVISKIDMLIMKISSVLHLSIDPKNMLVHDDRVDEAIKIAQAYIVHLKTLIRDSVVQALSDQDTAILDLLAKKPLNGKQIGDKLYRKVCFHSNGKMSRKFVVAAVEKLVERDLVTVVKSSKSFNDMVFAKS